MSFRGIDIREIGDRILSRVLLQDSAGALIISGTTEIRFYELQNDGTINTYDFNDDTFKSGACTDDEETMTHRQANNGTQNTGIWTHMHTPLTGFIPGNIYFIHVYNSGAFPTDQVREFQFGGTGDHSVILGTVNTGVSAASTTAFSAEDITEATANHYKDRVVIFTSGALKGQAAAITAYSLVSGEGRFTVTAMTDTPSDGDTFIIV